MFEKGLFTCQHENEYIQIACTNLLIIKSPSGLGLFRATQQTGFGSKISLECLSFTILVLALFASGLKLKHHTLLCHLFISPDKHELDYSLLS